MNVFLIHYNYDYQEWTQVYRSLSEVERALAAAFEIEDCMPGSERFWDRLMEEYERDDWKGLTINILDLETLKIRRFARAEEMKQ